MNGPTNETPQHEIKNQLRNNIPTPRVLRLIPVVIREKLVDAKQPTFGALPPLKRTLVCQQAEAFFQLRAGLFMEDLLSGDIPSAECLRRWRPLIMAISQMAT